MDALTELLADVRLRMPPLGGVYHLAMVLDDGIIPNLNCERFERGMSPKFRGLWNLHRLTRDLALDQFVAFSSISATLGGLGQANYAAANTAMEALMAHRRSLQLPAVAIGWGMLGEVGYVAHHRDIEKSLSEFGLAIMGVADIRDTLDNVIGANDFRRSPLTVAARIDWQVLSRRLHLADQPPGLLTDMAVAADDKDLASKTLRESISMAPPEERHALAENFVKSRVARVLGVSPQRVQDGLALSKMGLDSLMAVELASMIESDLGVSLPLRIAAGFLEIVCGVFYTPLLFLRSVLISELSPRERRQIILGYALLCLTWLVNLAVVWYFDLWSLFLAVVLVPMSLSGSLQTLNKFTQHLGLHGQTVLGLTRTVMEGSSAAKMVSSTLLYNDYHGTHHRYARIPYYHLPVATAYTVEHASEPCPVFPSIIRALIDMLPCLADPKVGFQSTAAADAATDRPPGEVEQAV